MRRKEHGKGREITRRKKRMEGVKKISETGAVTRRDGSKKKVRRGGKKERT